MARPWLRVETVPHARDKSITLIRYRREPDMPVWEAELTLPDGSKKIVSTRETDLSAAQFAAIEVTAKVQGKVEQTGSPALRARAKPSLPTFADAAQLGWPILHRSATSWCGNCATCRRSCWQRRSPRTLYSLRHYYAIRQIMAGPDIYLLAVRMGTSVQMIEKYYASALGRRQSGLAARYLDSDMDQLRARLARYEHAAADPHSDPAGEDYQAEADAKAGW